MVFNVLTFVNEWEIVRWEQLSFLEGFMTHGAQAQDSPLTKLDQFLSGSSKEAPLIWDV